ncbi:MAG: hypothetical protein L0Z53_09020, partial [Acidobacteriales bacterium]|nr:hypothetical protein [Terriglobales bacterium]
MARVYSAPYPMRIQARSGSVAEKKYYQKSALPGGAWPMPKVIAPGIDPSPLDDLMFHGGKVVPQMEFQNIYLGGDASWKASDIDSIDRAINTAMRDRRMNNVMIQYFPGAALACDMRESFILDEAKPAMLNEPDIQGLVITLHDSSLIKKSDLDTTLFNLILPSGTLLRLDDSSSLNGLGGYHGSLRIQRGGKTVTLYYSANVFSEIRADGKENGIAVFNQPWKNVVGTLYHEINEFRTDADVNDAIQNNSNDFLGWTSRRGHEVGDQPVFKAGQSGNLKLVFKEVSASNS